MVKTPAQIEIENELNQIKDQRIELADILSTEEGMRRCVQLIINKVKDIDVRLKTLENKI